MNPLKGRGRLIRIGGSEETRSLTSPNSWVWQTNVEKGNQSQSLRVTLQKINLSQQGEMIKSLEQKKEKRVIFSAIKIRTGKRLANCKRGKGIMSKRSATFGHTSRKKD